MSLENKYSQRLSMLESISELLEKDLIKQLSNIERIDRISTRVKNVDRFINKANKIENDLKKYDDPLNQIQDQIGARIIVLYLTDVNIVAEELKKFYRSIEEQIIIPDSEKEFGYEGKHYIFKLPTEVIPERFEESNPPSFFELQVKTLYQHAWSEASHDIAYKPGKKLTKEQLRKIAFTSAQSWGADNIFESLLVDLN